MIRQRRYLLPFVLLILVILSLPPLYIYILKNSNGGALEIWAVALPLLVAAGVCALFHLQRRGEIKSLMEGWGAYHEISALMTQEGPPAQWFEKTFEKIRERIPILSSSALFLADEERQTLNLDLSSRLPERVVSLLKREPLQLCEGAPGAVAKTGRSYFSSDRAGDPPTLSEKRPLFKEEGLFVLGCLPFRSKNRTVGVFSFLSATPTPLNAEEQKWLEAVGAQIGLAVESAKLREESLRKEKEALALFQLGQATTSSLTIDAVLSIILDHVAGITQSRAVLIMLYDPDQQALKVSAARGWSEQVSLNQLALRPGQGALGEAFQTEKIIFVPDVQNDPRIVYRDEAERSGVASIIGVPLIVKGKAIGVIGLYSPFLVQEGNLPQERRNILGAIASQAAIAIHNTQLYQDLEQKVRELKRLQGQLIQTEKLSAIGELVSGVAHELNNPLTSVIGFSQLLLDIIETPREREFLEKIFSEAMSCSEIIRNLLTFARRHPAEKSFNNVNHIVRKALELKIYQLETDGVEVTDRLSEMIPPALVDPHQLQQVFFNIINNAHQALLEKKKFNAGALKLAISSELKNDLISISFQDTGPGILPDVLPKIFEPFFTTKEVGVGTGLGLSISYGIVKEHGGEIRVENQFGEGACFIVTIPLIRREKEKETGGSTPSISQFVGKKILIVDDSTSSLEMCAYVLRLEGFHVETAGKGRLALERLRTDPYDLILIDMKLSDMGGRDFYETIARERPALTDKIIFSMDDEPTLETQLFLEENHLEYLGKPFSIVALKEVVYRCLTASLNA